jgi:hypothetical protein
MSKVGLFKTSANVPLIKRILKNTELGLNKKGIDYFTISDTEWKDCDIAINFGVYSKKFHQQTKGRKVIAERANKRIIIERGYVLREDYNSFGWNYHAGRGDYCNENMPSDRWNKLGVNLKPWNQGDVIIICGQVPWDTSVQHVNLSSWLLETINTLREYTDRQIVFRPHPLAQSKLKPTACIEISDKSLADDMKRAYAVVTFNSTMGVDAIINGTPVFVSDEGSLAYSVANKSLENIENPKMPNREIWANNLAYTQWNWGEISSGEWWEHLNVNK